MPAKTSHTPKATFYQANSARGALIEFCLAGGAYYSIELSPAHIPAGIDFVRTVNAAPDLLAALKAITTMYGVGYRNAAIFCRDVSPLMDEAQSAIRRAEGGECPKCKGAGYVNIQRAGREYGEDCPECSGTGFMP